MDLWRTKSDATQSPGGESCVSAPSRTMICLMLAACCVIWALARYVFFIGIAGSDDLFHVRFAAAWDRTPANHWEARLAANWLLRQFGLMFGFSEASTIVLPYLATAVIFIATIGFAYRLYGIAVAFWCGMLMAVLPSEVDSASVFTAHTPMRALLWCGTLAYLAAASRASFVWIAAVVLGMAVWTHLSGIFFVGILAVSGPLVGGGKFLRPSAMVLGGVAAFILLDFAVMHFAYGDVMARYRACVGELPSEDPAMPMMLDGVVNWRYFFWPIQTLFFSKQFGILMPFAIGYGFWVYRRSDVTLKILIVCAAAYCFWMSYGTKVPWEYQPFWRMTRFWAPAMPVAICLVAMMIVQFKSGVLRFTVSASVLGICLLNLLGSGPWAQNVEISKELLVVARQHPDRLFLTDPYTLNELYILNRAQSVSNVVTANVIHRARLFDPNTERLEESQLNRVDAVLVNPLNTDRSLAYAGLIDRHRGATLFQTTVNHRKICSFVPALKMTAWATRKPPAQVRAMQGAKLIAYPRISDVNVAAASASSVAAGKSTQLEIDERNLLTVTHSSTEEGECHE